MHAAGASRIKSKESRIKRDKKPGILNSRQETKA
jgi:hypothetical protein